MSFKGHGVLDIARVPCVDYRWAQQNVRKTIWQYSMTYGVNAFKKDWVCLALPPHTNVCLLWVTTGYMPVQELPSHTLPNFPFLLKSY